MRSFQQKVLLILGLGLGLGGAALVHAQESIEIAKASPNPSIFSSSSGNFRALMMQGIQERVSGQVYLAMNTLIRANQIAQSLQEQAQSAAEVGVLLAQVKRFNEAEIWLTRAYNLASAVDNPIERSRMALELGNVFASEGQKNLAANYFKEAQNSTHPTIRLSGAINAARLASQEASNIQRVVAALPYWQKELATLPEPYNRASLQLSLANFLLTTDDRALAKAVYDLAQAALLSAREQQHHRLEVAALDTLSDLYESENRSQDALRLAREGMAKANGSKDQDLIINLAWRLGRLYQQNGEADKAIESFTQAVNAISAIRIDIPVVYNDGRSSFRETLEPVYLGMADLLLKKARQDPANAAQWLKAARNAAEGVKQSELQDYLGDRCTVESAQDANRGTIPAGTAVFYPIIFEDRVETLVETASGLKSYAVAIPKFQINNQAKRFSNLLRNGYAQTQNLSNDLYKVLIQPIEADLSDNQIQKIVVVPDGVLRLVPYSALFDGNQYVLEKYAVSVSSALSLTQQNTSKSRQKLSVLVAGLETPGSVVNTLEAINNNQGNVDLRPSGEKMQSCGNKEEVPMPRTRAVNVSALDTRLDGLTCQLSSDPSVARALAMREDSLANEAKKTTENLLPTIKTRSLTTDALRESLRLPGVINEVNEVKNATSATVILNQEFTLGRFTQEVQSGNFNVVHIASHGVFGGSGDNSYILSNDQLITMNSLQNILLSESLTGKNIELLSLSACETADGDDRAPLGISGAALKARARSALGTLWPVADEAAQKVMIAFYREFMTGKSKTEALREAQLLLLKDKNLNAPYFWAPFTLVGQWD